MFQKLLKLAARPRRWVAMWLFQYFYDDLTDYAYMDEECFQFEHEGLELCFPVLRERLFIIIDGNPLVVQEGNQNFVNTKAYQFQAAVNMGKKGHKVYTVHNHPGGYALPSDLDMEVARKYPEIDHYIATLHDDVAVLTKYNSKGVIEEV